MKRIVILGAGESGAGAAVLAQKQGFDVFVSDTSAIKPQYKQLLAAHHIEWEEGHHSEERILRADEVVKSPGIPHTAPMVQRLAAQGTPIISEIELAGRYTDAKMVCITGSNGKTTTTSLIHHIFRQAGVDAGLAGNIGHSLALQVAMDPHPWYVIELSSFQLDNMYRFRADIAVLLNITPDHLDRYDFKFENYAAAKMRIMQNQRPQDSFIYWADDPVVTSMLPPMGDGARRLPFAIGGRPGLAATVDGDEYRIDTPPSFTMPHAELSLPGRHNDLNQLAAGLAAAAAGIAPEAIRRGLATFPGVEHRLERVLTVGGVDYVNDSKATNVDACRCALEAMTRPTILILGGRDKGNDYSAITELVRQKCAGLVYLGADNDKLHRCFDQLGLPVADTHSMADCVAAATAMARPGQTVLLSPCCASFDLFRNMEDRGDQFKERVKALAATHDS